MHMILPIVGLVVVVAGVVVFLRSLWRGNPEPREGAPPSANIDGGGNGGGGGGYTSL